MPTAIVVPERDRPGITAQACARPIITASFSVMDFAVLCPGVTYLSEMNRIVPVTIRAKAIKPVLEKRRLTAPLNISAMKRGSVAATMKSA